MRQHQQQKRNDGLYGVRGVIYLGRGKGAGGEGGELLKLGKRIGIHELVEWERQ